MGKLGFILMALISCTLCHPHPYPPRGVNSKVTNGQIEYIRDPQCYDPKPAKIFSWHLHVLFHQRNKAMMEDALRLYQEIADYLGLDANSSTCDLSFNDSMCLFKPVTVIEPPFLTGQWGLYFFTEDLVKVSNWITTNRGTLDTLIHPNSGCDIEDHSWWVIWSGQPWPLDFSIFKDDPWEKTSHTQERRKIELRSRQQIIEDSRTTELVKLFLAESESEEKGKYIYFKN